MDSLTLKFDSYEQIQYIARFVESIFNVYNKSSLDTIKSLNSKLESVDSETMLNIDLSNDEISLLGHICDTLSCIDADEFIAGCDISSKIARLTNAKIVGGTKMDTKLDYNQIIVDASNRLHAIINACINKDNDSIVCNTCSSVYSSEKDIPVEGEEHPVLDQDFCFKYRGYDFELSACTNITSKNQIIGLTDENFKQQFPHDILTDRYVCWMYGHKDIIGHTKDYVDDPEDWAPMIYLVPDAWAYGAEYGLVPGNRVARCIIEAIDKFLETFKE